MRRWSCCRVRASTCSASPCSTSWLTTAWAGALIVLFLNTAAYSAEIFYGALRSIPKGDLEAADAYGITGWARFRRIQWPTMLRLGWPAYTNEAIFLFHATTLVFFSGFPAFAAKGRCAVLCQLFCRQNLQPLHPLSRSSPSISSA